MKIKRVYFLLIFCVFVLGIASIPNVQCYPPAGTSHFDPCTAQATFEIFGVGTVTGTVTGSIDVQASDPYDPGDGRIKIDTEIISSNLVGTSPLGPITITGSPTAISSGAIQQQVAGNDFPAGSWFYAFFEIHTTLPYPYSIIHNYPYPIPIGAVIYSLPPYGTTYTSPTLNIPLFDELDRAVGLIKYMSFTLPPPPEYTLTILSSPTGATFTVDGVPRATPWSGTYSEGTSVSLVMPETHDGYVWSHWLEDGDTNRIKTVTMDTDITLTGVYASVPKPVGGKATPINIPMNKPETPTLWIWLSTIILPLTATAVFVKHKKKKQ